MKAPLSIHTDSQGTVSTVTAQVGEARGESAVENSPTVTAVNKV